MPLQAYWRNPDGVLQGEIDWRSISAEQVWNTAGTFTITTVMNDAAVTAMGEGWGAVVSWPERGWEQSGDWSTGTGERSGATGTDASTSGRGQLTFTAMDDLSILADELASANPAGLFDASVRTVGAVYDTRTGAAETVVKAYVSANVGTGRSTNRWLPVTPATPQRLLTVATARGEGGTITGNARFAPLLDFLRSITAQTPLRMWITTNPSTGALVFDCTPVVNHRDDVNDPVVFSIEGGSLASVQWSWTKPTSNVGVALGPGTGAARTIWQDGDTASVAAWRRAVRVTYDQRSANATTPGPELAKAVADGITENVQTGVRSTELIDTPNLRYGVDYQLGDLVWIEVLPATATQAAVRYGNHIQSVSLDAGPTGARITASTVDRAQGRGLTRYVRGLERRLIAYDLGL